LPERSFRWLRLDGVASADPQEFVAKVSHDAQASAEGFDIPVEHIPRGDVKLPRLRHDGLGGAMRRGRTLFWTITGSVVAAVAVVIALILVNSGTPPKAASAPVPPTSASPSSQAGESAPVVVPETSSTSSFKYLSDLTPSGKFGELVNPGPVKISGSIYPKSISFYCNVGDPTAFPAYKLKHNARRFKATVGLAAKLPPNFEAGIVLVGDGHTLRTFSVSALRPNTVNVNVTGVHMLQLECFGSGGSPTAGFAIAVAWGNARISEGH
jgi:hypothetical protein